MKVTGLNIDPPVKASPKVEDPDDPAEVICLKRAVDRLEKGQHHAAMSAAVDAVNLIAKAHGLNGYAQL